MNAERRWAGKTDAGGTPAHPERGLPARISAIAIENPDVASTLPHLGWHARGYLPHCDFPGLVQSLGFRLFDCVPASVVDRWTGELKQLPDDQRRIKLNERIDRFVDYFDEYMRTTALMEATIQYIEFNPVAAKLVALPENWRFSSSARHHQERVKQNRLRFSEITTENLP